MAIENLGRITGKSAYELAVDHGYVGTEKQWVKSIVKGVKGDAGTTGFVNGVPIETVLEQKASVQTVNQVVLQLADKATKTVIDSELALKAEKSEVATLITRVTGIDRGYGETYTTLALLQAAYPNGNNKRYVVSADKNWYFWNGTAWVAGGVFQGQGNAAGSITYEMISQDAIPNLLIAGEITRNKYLDSSNNVPVIKDSTAFSYSGYIPVIPGKSYDAYFGDGSNGVTGIPGFFYKADKSYLSRMAVPPSVESRITSPVNAYWWRINLTNAKEANWYVKPAEPQKKQINWLDVKKENLSPDVLALIENNISIENKWYGKTANFLGDSNTDGYGLTNRDVERYSTLVASALGMTANNYGNSGSRIAKVGTSVGSFLTLYPNMSNSADIIFVLGGTNDYAHTVNNAGSAVPIGVFTDRVVTTFYGALHTLFKGLIDKYPGKPIIIITPAHMTAPSGLTGDDYTLNPDSGKNLLDFVKAEREVAEYYGLPVIDLFKNLSINPNVPSLKTAYMPDGIHFNASGHKLVADKIINFMKQI